jgi:hypothetical protein
MTCLLSLIVSFPNLVWLGVQILGSADFAEFEDGSPYWVIFRNMFADKTLGLWNYLLSLLKNHRTVGNHCGA